MAAMASARVNAPSYNARPMIAPSIPSDCHVGEFVQILQVADSTRRQPRAPSSLCRHHASRWKFGPFIVPSL